MSITRSRRRIGQARLQKLLRSLLDASPLCAIATVAGTRAHVNTAYFAWSEDFRLVWISDPGATHSRNLRRSSSAAVAVFDSHQTWGRSDRGVQLFGTAGELRGRAAERAAGVYARRFRNYDLAEQRDYRCYELRGPARQAVRRAGARPGRLRQRADRPGWIDGVGANRGVQAVVTRQNRIA